MRPLFRSSTYRPPSRRTDTLLVARPFVELGVEGARACGDSVLICSSTWWRVKDLNGYVARKEKPMTSKRVQEIRLQSIVALCRVVVFVAQTKSKTDSQTDDDDNDESNEQAPPLQFAGVASTLNTLVELNVTGFGVLLNVFRVLLGLLDHRFLDDDGFGKILKELVQLDQSTLNLLNVVVTSTHSAENGAGSGRAVSLELEMMLACIIEDRARAKHTAVWKTPSLPQSALEASWTSASVASGLTMRY